MSPEESKATDSSKPFDAELRQDLLKQLAMLLPMLGISMIGATLSDSFNHPENALPIILPAIVIEALILVRSTTRQKLQLGWSAFIFVLLYVLIFCVAAATNILDWKRTLVGKQDDVPHYAVALNRLGDWHYKFAAEEPALPNLVIVLMKPVGRLPDARPDPRGRVDLADLLAIAQDAGAKGVAIDSYFVDPTTVKGFVDPTKVKSAKEIGIDNRLCTRVEEAKKSAMKVFVAYDFESTQDRLTPIKIDAALGRCLPESDQGHIRGYADRDGVIRSLPMYFWNDGENEALSLKIARSLNSTVRTPDNGVLQFTKPKNEFTTVTFEQLNEPDANRNILNRSFILVGDDSSRDSFRTPFGVKHGVVIHAYAVQALIQGRFIRRPRWSLDFFQIGIWCYLLTLLTVRGGGNRQLTLVNIAASLVIVGIAVFAMRRWLIWIDLIYPLLAGWFLLFLIVLWRRIGKIRTSSVADA